MSNNHLCIPRRLCGKKDHIRPYWCGPDMDWGPSWSVIAELCLSWFPSMFSALSPRYTAPPQTLINHSTHWVTFALFKRILQTLAFRKYNYLPFHISAANIPALWAVYLIVFVYRLTFLLYFHFHQIEIVVCASLCESLSGKRNIWCAFYDVDIEILATVNMNRLSSLSHTGLAI